MRPEPFSVEDSDESRTLVQESELLYERDAQGQRRSFAPRRSSSHAPDRESILPGSILAGTYRVEQVAERTTHEVVLIARHVDLGEPVVLRHLTEEGADSPEVVASFLRGARDALKLKGFHVERVADLGHLASGAPYRVSELPRGPSLEEFVRVRGPLPSEDAVDLVLLACEGVAEAHALGQVHRNLSTTNIVLERHPDGAPLVKVKGFGLPDPLAYDPDLAGRFGRQFPGRSSNALRYASPEQIREPDAVDQRADIWALGAILYELLAGVPVYSAKATSGLLAMIVADPPVPLDQYCTELDPNLEAAVMSCLSKDPAERPSSIAELVDALAPYGSEQINGVATRISRVLSPTPVSHRPFPSAAPRRTIPALPERTSGPYYGHSYYAPAPARDFGRSVSSKRTTASAAQRPRSYRNPVLEAEPSTPKAHTLMLLLAGAALGGVIVFLAGSGFRIVKIEPPATASAMPAPAPTANVVPVVTASASVAAAPPAPPPVRRERRPVAERADEPEAESKSTERTEEETASHAVKTERERPAVPVEDEQALFDKPE